MLKATSLVFGYEKANVLNDVSFELPRGEICVVLGANGSGKSTLIKMLAGILQPKSGKIELDGKATGEYKRAEYAAKIGYVPQNPYFDSSTVLDAVLIGRLPTFKAPGKHDRERAEQALESVGIDHLALKDASKLSGGEKQKVAIARTLAGDAELMLLDEPVSELDLKSKYSTLKILKECAEKGKAVFMSMHDINEAVDTGDMFLVLKDGRVAAFGDREVLTEALLYEVFGVRLQRVEHGNKIHFHMEEE